MPAATDNVMDDGEVCIDGVHVVPARGVAGACGHVFWHVRNKRYQLRAATEAIANEMETFLIDKYDNHIGSRPHI